MENSPSILNGESPEEPGHRAVAPEAHQLHGKELAPESIGQVLVAADINAATKSRSESLDLSREILEREMDFERDPQLRHRLSQSDGRPKNLSLKDLLAKTGIVETEDTASRQTIASKPPASPEHLEQHLKQQAHQRKLLDFAFIGIILILLILVILLALSRR